MLSCPLTACAQLPLECIKNKKHITPKRVWCLGLHHVTFLGGRLLLQHWLRNQTSIDGFFFQRCQLPGEDKASVCGEKFSHWVSTVYHLELVWLKFVMVASWHPRCLLLSDTTMLVISRATTVSAIGPYDCSQLAASYQFTISWICSCVFHQNAKNVMCQNKADFNHNLDWIFLFISSLTFDYLHWLLHPIDLEDDFCHHCPQLTFSSEWPWIWPLCPSPWPWLSPPREHPAPADTYGTSGTDHSIVAAFDREEISSHHSSSYLTAPLDAGLTV